MNRPLAAALIGLAALLGAAFGAAAFWLLTGPILSDDVRFGAWRSTMAVGESKQSPYSRARVALYGIWGLPPREVIYFTTTNDAAGERLRPDCTYQLTGGAVPARWWSVTLYRDGFYIPNPANRYSWSMSDVAMDADGRWTLTFRPAGEGRNVLTFGDTPGDFQVLFRLYQPQPKIVADRSQVTLPVLRRTNCPGA